MLDFVAPLQVSPAPPRKYSRIIRKLFDNRAFVHQYSKQVFDIREKPANGSSTKDSQGHPLTLASRSDSSERFKVFPFREGSRSGEEGQNLAWTALHAADSFNSRVGRVGKMARWDLAFSQLLTKIQRKNLTLTASYWFREGGTVGLGEETVVCRVVRAPCCWGLADSNPHIFICIRIYTHICMYTYHIYYTYIDMYFKYTSIYIYLYLYIYIYIYIYGTPVRLSVSVYNP